MNHHLILSGEKPAPTNVHGRAHAIPKQPRQLVFNQKFSIHPQLLLAKPLASVSNAIFVAPVRTGSAVIEASRVDFATFEESSSATK